MTEHPAGPEPRAGRGKCVAAPNAIWGLAAMPTQQNAEAPRLWAVRLFFFLAGLGMAAWAFVAPSIKIRFGLDDGTLGLMLLAGGIGGLISMPLCSLLIVRVGSRAVLFGASLLLSLLLPLLSMAPSAAAFTALLLLYGLVFGGVDVAMNSQAALIETRSGGRQMSLFHAFFSIGGLAVALAASLALHLGAATLLCAAVVALAMLSILPQGRRLLPRGFDSRPAGRHFVLPNRATLVLGLCCFSCFLTEGAVTDWSTIFLRFSRAMPLASAPLGYGAFAVAMAASRLLGDRLAGRLGATSVMRLGGGVAVLGLLLAVTLPYGVSGIAGFGLVGLGLGNTVPLIFSAAARVPGIPASLSMPAVVGLGYAGFLTGPVAIGLIANRLSLSAALGLNAALLFATLFAARAVAAEP